MNDRKEICRKNIMRFLSNGGGKAAIRDVKPIYYVTYTMNRTCMNTRSENVYSFLLAMERDELIACDLDCDGDVSHVKLTNKGLQVARG